MLSEFARRIDFEGRLEPTLECLTALQTYCLLAVPFENLDIHIGREIVLGGGRQAAKIVGERRGGFCYECNTVLHDALVEIGFDIRMVNAQIMNGGPPAPPFDHMALIVTLDDIDYLVDVGTGAFGKSHASCNRF